MSKDQERTRWLRAVPGLPAERHGEQMTLFSTSDTVVLVLNMSKIEGSDFLHVVQEYGPRWAVDLRPFPIFSDRGLSRAKAFDAFARSSCLYLDFAGIKNVTKSFDVGLNPESIAGALESRLGSSTGPILLLDERRNDPHQFYDALISRLPSPRNQAWVLKFLPSSTVLV